jgi:HlyD family secretion protein
MFAGGVVALMVGTMWFLYVKSRPRAAVVETDRPLLTDILKKTVAAGAIQPRKEVEIKPKVAGILKKLHVLPGDQVKRGDLIGEVQIIPDPVNLNEAELRLKSSMLREERSRQELGRIEALAGRGALPRAELERARNEHSLSVEEVNTSKSRLQLMRSGALSQAKGGSTQIESTVDGMVLSIPVKEGSSVINANSFNPGTTVAFVADMTDMIFKGSIDESEVGKLRVGMPVEIVIGALNDLKFEGKLEFVAPKSLVKEGTTEFEIEAAFRPPEGITVRAGYSANANIVLDRRENVLAISESLLLFERGKTFVEVQTGPDKFERRAVKVGLSDGLNVEVIEGVKAGLVLRKPVAGL